MTILPLRSGVALMAGVAVTAAVACSTYRVTVPDGSRSGALAMAIASAERERMAHVSMIVETQRRLARAEDLLDMDAIGRLTAEADQEQVTYAHLVHAELVLRREWALAHPTNR